mmetsp:Transcript_3027/g.9922  ORF Transcript_3027/g.9922 Transcript_3027/m.9922 type:complete len:279 (+) Transcript_3027:680-1516(+)
MRLIEPDAPTRCTSTPMAKAAFDLVRYSSDAACGRTAAKSADAVWPSSVLNESTHSAMAPTSNPFTLSTVPSAVSRLTSSGANVVRKTSKNASPVRAANLMSTSRAASNSSVYRSDAMSSVSSSASAKSAWQTVWYCKAAARAPTSDASCGGGTSASASLMTTNAAAATVGDGSSRAVPISTSKRKPRLPSVGSSRMRRMSVSCAADRTSSTGNCSTWTSDDTRSCTACSASPSTWASMCSADTFSCTYAWAIVTPCFAREAKPSSPSPSSASSSPSE